MTISCFSSLYTIYGLSRSYHSFKRVGLVEEGQKEISSSFLVSLSLSLSSILQAPCLSPFRFHSLLLDLTLAICNSSRQPDRLHSDSKQISRGIEISTITSYLDFIPANKKYTSTDNTEQSTCPWNFVPSR